MHPLNPINTSKGKTKEMNEKTILCEVHLFDLFLKGSSRVRDSNQSGYLFWQLLTTPKILLTFFFIFIPLGGTGWNTRKHKPLTSVMLCGWFFPHNPAMTSFVVDVVDPAFSEVVLANADASNLEDLEESLGALSSFKNGLSAVPEMR
jgi:4-amino-4-deoxy-L-arabinose transferase-like glycosyltransferase